MLTLVAGTMFCMWIGEKITEKGIGNGISMLIMVGIISRLPAALIAEGLAKGMKGSLFILIEVVVLVLIVMVVAFQVAGKAITEQSNQIPHNTAITTSLKEIAFLKQIIVEYLT